LDREELVTLILTGQKQIFRLTILLFSMLSILNEECYGQQKRRLEGIVIDTAGMPIEGVTIRLTTMADTFLTATIENGSYFFNDVVGHDFKLSFSIIGYKLLERTFYENASPSILRLAPVRLERQQLMLKEVNINQLGILMLGRDTLQYFFDPYHFSKKTLLEAALKRLPNVQVGRDGKVTAGGKQVNKVRVDGKNFFGGDVLIATRNLHADAISHIQIINDYGDWSNATGIQDKEPEVIMNIVLKEDRKKLQFGQVTAGSGTEERYLGSVGLNNFNDGQEFSILGSINNTNTSLFSYGSPTGIGSRDRRAIDLTGMTDPIDGVNITRSVGVTFSDSLAKNMDSYGKYTFTNRKNSTVSDMLMQTDFLENTILNREDKEVFTDHRQHELAWDIDYAISSKDNLKISPRFSVQDARSVLVSNKFLQSQSVTSEGEYGIDGKHMTPNIHLDLLYTKSFNKPRRRLLLALNGDNFIQNRDDRIGDYFVSIDSSFVAPAIEIYSLLQKNDNYNRNRVRKLKTAFIEPLSSKALLEWNYSFENNNISSKREVRDLEENKLIDSLSIRYDYLFRNHQTGFMLQVDQSKRFKYMIGLALQSQLLKGSTLDRSVLTRNQHINLIPSANIRIHLSEEIELSIDYLGTNNQPHFMQMQPVKDLSNSQLIILGNADLKSEFQNRLNTRLRKMSFDKNRMFELQVAYNKVQNKIVNDRTLLPNSTVQVMSYRNTSGYFDLHSDYMYSMGLGSADLQLNFNGSSDYIHTISYLNENKQTVKHFVFYQLAQLRYSINDVLDSEINSSYTVNRSRSALPNIGDLHANSWLMGMAARGYISDQWSFGFDVSHQINTGYSHYVSSNPTLINGYIEYTFFSNNMALLRLQGYDLLNQNMGITKEIFDNTSMDLRNNRLSRYVMLSLNIRLQKHPSSKI
jgi:hypothetical protein